MPVRQVFISYSHENQTSAEQLQADLAANGIAIWIDDENLIPGTPDWGQAIEDGIPQCQALVYVASPAAKKSPFVLHELDLAEDQIIPIYPFWVEGARWRDVAPFGRSRMQYIDARSDYQRAFKELLKTLRAQSTPVKPSSSQGHAQPALGATVPDTTATPATGGSASKSHLPKTPRPVFRVLGTVAILLTALALTVTLIVSGTPTALMRFLQSRAATPITTPHIALTETPAKQSTPTSTPLAPTSTPLAPTATPTNRPAHWTQVLSPNPNPNHDNVSDIAAIAPNNVWMVGSTGDGGEANPFRTLVEHWNGSSWAAVASPNPDATGSELYAIAALAPNNIWAAGNVIEHWDGSSWSAVLGLNTAFSYNNVSGMVALAPDNIWAVGSSFTFTSGSSNISVRTLIEHWDGGSWKEVPSPSPDAKGDDLTSITAIGIDDIWAVGARWQSTDPSGPHSSLIEHWNGSSWTVVSSPDPGAYSNFLSGVTALAPNNVWAVGYSSKNANDPARTLIEHWNGSSWSVAASANKGSGNNALGAIAALAANDIWAVGAASQNTLIEHWNGSSWAVVASPNPNPTYNSLNAITALAPDTIWAAGANGNGTLTERWVSSS